MTEIRPGAREYVVATKAVVHGAPCVEKNYVGVALKQIAAPAGTGLGSSLINTIQVTEAFVIATKGRVYITNPASAFAKGDPVYITVADNSLVAGAGTGIVKFGRVAEIAGERGVGTGKMRVDLDAKDSF